jgi:hypothetical protein
LDQINLAFLLLDRFEIVRDPQAINDRSIYSTPVPLPSPTFFGAWGLRFDVLSGFLGRKRLLALRATGKTSFQKLSSARTTLEIWLHVCRNLSLSTLDAARPLLAPARQQCGLSARITIRVRVIGKAAVQQLQVKRVSAMLACSCHTLPKSSSQEHTLRFGISAAGSPLRQLRVTPAKRFNLSAH